jgi:hypothetical protein
MKEASKVIYEIEATTNYGKPWAWCHFVQWVEGKMDFLAPGPNTDRYKEACALYENYAPGLHIDDVGSEWPDWLGCAGAAQLRFVVSGKVLESLNEAEIPYRRATEMPIGGIASSALRKKTPPKYYVLEADVGMDIDLVTVPLPLPNPPHPTEPVRPQQYMPSESYWAGDRSTWNGLHLFTGRCSPGTPQDYTWLFCTYKVWWQAQVDKWTNFQCEKIQLY